MKDIRFAVPSYKRAETLKTKTLPLLLSRGVPLDKIDVFVADEDELNEYKKVSPEIADQLIVAVPGMMAVRNFIRKYYDEGVPVVSIDDDISDMVMLVDKKTVKPLEDILAFSEMLFKLCEERGLRLWGIYPVKNPYFMRPNITYDLRYICGGFWGIFNSHEEKLMVTLDDKEDFERSIQYYIYDGGVARANHVALATKGYGGAGGMQEDRTEERITESAIWLTKKYPMFCSLNLTKKSGKAEVRLRDTRKRKR